MNVFVKVLLLRRADSVDHFICKEYDKMFKENEKYEFLCYCDKAQIDSYYLSFVAYKPKKDNGENLLKRKRILTGDTIV